MLHATWTFKRGHFPCQHMDNGTIIYCCLEAPSDMYSAMVPYIGDDASVVMRYKLAVFFSFFVCFFLLFAFVSGGFIATALSCNSTAFAVCGFIALRVGIRIFSCMISLNKLQVCFIEENRWFNCIM